MPDPIQYVAGSVVSIAFPIDDPLGDPMPLEGLYMRMRILTGGADWVVTGYATEAELLAVEGGVPFTHPYCIGFDLSPISMLQVSGTYPAVIEVDDGDGWRALPVCTLVVAVRGAW